jgi:hypothetical protein
MTAWASQQTGDWSRSSENADSPWYDGSTQTGYASVPGDGDTVEIDHDVNVDANTTIGTTPDDTTTNAILVDNGTLTVETGVTLTCRGRLYLDAAGLTLQAGSEVVLDSSQHASLTPMYRIDGSNGGNTFTFSGTSGSHVTVRGTNDTYRGVIDFNAWSGGDVSVTYTDFEDLGSGSSLGVDSYVYLSDVSITGCTFTDCAGIKIYQASATKDFTVSRNVCSGTGSATSYFFAPAPTTGTRTFEDNVVDFSLGSQNSLPGTTISRCYFHDTLILGAAADTTGDIEDCFIRATGADNNVVTHKSLKDCFLLHESSVNPHFMYAKTDDRALDIDGNIFESSYNGDQSGDVVLNSNEADAGNKCTIKNNIVLPNAAGISPGSLLNCLTSTANWFGDVYHNTCCVKLGLLVGETYAGHAGMIANCKSNVWFKTSGNGYAATRQNNAGTPVQDIITPANYDYNWHYNLDAGSEGGGFNDNETSEPSMFSTVPTNSNGGTADPQFVDATRDLGSWGSTEESTDGSVAAALAVLQADTSKIAELVTWVKAGFKVQNSSLNNAGHDGETIGAMAFDSVPAKWSLVGNNYVRS